MKNKKDLISIIINCYNGEKYLARSIKSVINQSHKNWEIIFWDNKSTDNSFKILNKFKDKRIKYFLSPKHEKLYNARNSAIKKAKGKFIAFLDTDDTWKRNKLNLQINHLKKTKSDICFTNYLINKNKREYAFKKNLHSRNINNQILNEYPIGILTVLMKANIFFKNKIFFNKNYEIIGDFDYFYRLSKLFKFSSINKYLATYYIHKENLSVKKLNVEINEFKRWIRINNNYLKNKKHNLIKNNNLRMCNYLLQKKKLNFFSKELTNIDDEKVKFKFYIKIILQKINIL